MIFNYYIAKISASGCFLDLRINDVPLVMQNIKGNYSAGIPFNFLIEKSGMQTLSLSVLPILGQLSAKGANCDVEIWKYDGTQYELAPIEMVTSLSIDIKDEVIPVKTLNRIFLADVAYQINRWNNCISLEKNNSLTSEVMSFYKRVAKLLAEKKYDSFISLIHNRESKICTALALDNENVDKRNTMLFHYLDNGFEPCELKGGKMIRFFANKRLVSILDSDFQSALKFRNSETRETIAVELLLGKENGSQKLSVI